MLAEKSLPRHLSQVFVFMYMLLGATTHLPPPERDKTCQWCLRSPSQHKSTEQTAEIKAAACTTGASSWLHKQDKGEKRGDTLCGEGQGRIGPVWQLN